MLLCLCVCLLADWTHSAAGSQSHWSLKLSVSISFGHLCLCVYFSRCFQKVYGWFLSKSRKQREKDELWIHSWHTNYNFFLLCRPVTNSLQENYDLMPFFSTFQIFSKQQTELRMKVSNVPSLSEVKCLRIENHSCRVRDSLTTILLCHPSRMTLSPHGSQLRLLQSTVQHRLKKKSFNYQEKTSLHVFLIQFWNNFYQKPDNPNTA